ncbi:hypothetical protein FGW37_21060 [Streptomyces rectiverticillatus]|nr:hypothetical protein FGW37_21060 [Streptomyces rectiverticillatus]
MTGGPGARAVRGWVGAFRTRGACGGLPGIVVSGRSGIPLGRGCGRRGGGRVAGAGTGSAPAGARSRGPAVRGRAVPAVRGSGGPGGGVLGPGHSGPCRPGPRGPGPVRRGPGGPGGGRPGPGGPGLCGLGPGGPGAGSRRPGGPGPCGPGLRGGGRRRRARGRRRALGREALRLRVGAPARPRAGRGVRRRARPRVRVVASLGRHALRGRSVRGAGQGGAPVVRTARALRPGGRSRAPRFRVRGRGSGGRGGLPHRGDPLASVGVGVLRHAWGSIRRGRAPARAGAPWVRRVAD